MLDNIRRRPRYSLGLALTGLAGTAAIAVSLALAPAAAAAPPVHAVAPAATAQAAPHGAATHHRVKCYTLTDGAGHLLAYKGAITADHNSSSAFCTNGVLDVNIEFPIKGTKQCMNYSWAARKVNLRACAGSGTSAKWAAAFYSTKNGGEWYIGNEWAYNHAGKFKCKSGEYPYLTAPKTDGKVIEACSAGGGFPRRSQIFAHARS